MADNPRALPAHTEFCICGAFPYLSWKCCSLLSPAKRWSVFICTPAHGEWIELQPHHLCKENRAPHLGKGIQLFFIVEDPQHSSTQRAAGSCKRDRGGELICDLAWDHDGTNTPTVLLIVLMSRIRLSPNRIYSSVEFCQDVPETACSGLGPQKGSHSRPDAPKAVASWTYHTTDSLL